MTVILLLILFLLAVIALIISYVCYRIAFYSPMKGRDAIPEVSDSIYDPYRVVMKRIFSQLSAREYEDVCIQSHDGLMLAGKYYHTKDGAPLAIAFHGYRSSGMTDFAGGSEFCFEMEHNLLLIDERSHGRSQGKAITFGILERLDCLSWGQYALERFGPDVKIVLYGVSMGAATVLMASDLSLPDNVKGIVADCPYSSPSAIIKDVCRKMHYPPNLSYPFICIGAKIFAGFNLNATTAAKSVENAKVPILIIHGEGDNFVPPEMSNEICLKRPDLIQRATFPGAGHGISFLTDDARYKQIVKEFIEQIL